MSFLILATQTLEFTASYSYGESEGLFWGLSSFTCFVLFPSHAKSYQMQVNEKRDWEPVKKTEVLSKLVLERGRENGRGRREGGRREGEIEIEIDRFGNPWEVLLSKFHHLTSSCF